MITVGPFVSSFRWRGETYFVSTQEWLSCKHGHQHIAIRPAWKPKPARETWCCIESIGASRLWNAHEWLLFGPSLREKLAEAITDVDTQRAVTAASIPAGETVFWL